MARYKCKCKNGKTWSGSDDACNKNASNCRLCCAGWVYGGVDSGRTGGIGGGSNRPSEGVIIRTGDHRRFQNIKRVNRNIYNL
jgi:hypothetical protein